MLSLTAQEAIAELRSKGYGYRDIQNLIAAFNPPSPSVVEEVRDYVRDIVAAPAKFGGPVEVDGVMYQVIENANHACHPDNDDWEAEAVRLKDGALCKVYWDQISASDDAGDACDWEHPYRAERV